MIGLMTVKRHREEMAQKDKAMVEQGRRLIAANKENATLRAQLPTRGDKGKFARRGGV